jgi:hypothetical protein
MQGQLLTGLIVCDLWQEHLYFDKFREAQRRTENWALKQIIFRFRLLEVILYYWIEVLMEVAMHSVAFFVATPCSSERARRFGGIYRLHLQGRRVSQTRYQQKQAASWVQLSELHGVTPHTVVLCSFILVFTLGFIFSEPDKCSIKTGFPFFPFSNLNRFYIVFYCNNKSVKIEPSKTWCVVAFIWLGRDTYHSGESEPSGCRISGGGGLCISFIVVLFVRTEMCNYFYLRARLVGFEVTAGQSAWWAMWFKHC